MRPINKAIIHDSSRYSEENIDFLQFKSIEGSAINSRLPHHFYIEPNGNIIAARPLYAPTTIFQKLSFNALTICVLGASSFTRQQFKALSTLIISFDAVFHFNGKIWAHNSLEVTSECPHFDIQKELDPNVFRKEY